MALDVIPDLNKAFRNFLTNTQLMFALLPRKENFTQLETYGNYFKKTYLSGFSKIFDWVGFNLELSNRLLGGRRQEGYCYRPELYLQVGQAYSFFTDTDMSAKNVVEFYRTHFQIEF